MQFGVTVPNNWGIEDVNEALAFGPLAEALGYDSVWVMDHLFNNGYIRERLDDKPYYHPLATLTYLSATTSRVLLGTSVLVLPYHNPVELAKYTATLDQMSGGRVTLGIGVGAMTEEFEALGIPMSERASLTNECIRVMRELWSNPAPSYHSRRWNFDDLRFSPKPVQQPHIPIWVGGASPGAIRRAARMGDGWHPSGVSPEEYASRKAEIAELAQAAGRNVDNMVWSARVEVEATPGPSSERAASRSRIPGHDLEQTALSIAAYRDAGVEHLVLALNTGDVNRIRELMESLANETIPQFR
ncbi:MAG: LLM class F420-dependent oxidoreductase [Chloroflexota bacterium]|nr:LLM class F420-dependent oxidoreductase [Chloroflexota bacterium]